MGSTAAAAALLGLAGWQASASTGWFWLMLAVGTCAAGAAFGLDEACAELADASPTPRRVRTGWQLVSATLPLSVGTAGVLLLPAPHGVSAWRIVLPLAGCVAVAVAASAMLRRAGWASPGDLVSCIVGPLVATLLLTEPLRRWVSLVDVGAGSWWTSGMVWAAVLIGTVCTTAWALRDPAGRGRTGAEGRPGAT